MTPRSRGSGGAARWLLLLAVLLMPTSVGCSRSTGLELGEERVASDEDRVAAAMVERIREISERRAASDGFVRRFNQIKTLGCVRARFEVPGLQGELARGLFARRGSYSAYIRFANATQDDDREADFRGMSIRVDGVEGARTATGGAGTRQDFLLNSHPALFAATPEDFLSFIVATARGRQLLYFLNPLDSHLYSLRIVLAGREVATNPLEVRYWSTTPFRFGPDERVAVKFSAAPCSRPEGGEVGDHPDFLTEAMAASLETGRACFDFMVQRQTDPDQMPIEDASVVWPEELTPFRPVAKILIDPQTFTDEASMAACEASSFSPWNTLPEHQPLGGINRVRRKVYQQTSEFRAASNRR